MSALTPKLGLGRKVCAICGRKRSVIGWCDDCRASYDRAIARDDGTILASVTWAAKRARRFAKGKP